MQEIRTHNKGIDVISVHMFFFRNQRPLNRKANIIKSLNQTLFIESKTVKRECVK